MQRVLAMGVRLPRGLEFGLAQRVAGDDAILMPWLPVIPNQLQDALPHDLGIGLELACCPPILDGFDRNEPERHSWKSLNIRKHVASNSGEFFLKSATVERPPFADLIAWAEVYSAARDAADFPLAPEAVSDIVWRAFAIGPNRLLDDLTRHAA